LIALVLGAWSTALYAVEIVSVDVQVSSGRYHLRGESVIDAPPNFIRGILMDYDNFHRLTNGISETRFIEQPNNEPPLGYTRVDSCILFFCRHAVKTERIVVNTPDEIITEAIPEKSDFRYNHTRWIFKPHTDGTLVIYEAEMEPDFWLPPIIGPWAIKRKLEQSAEDIGIQIEYLAESGKPITSLNNNGTPVN